MSDRLTELQRQRALAQEQLAWFDREIAKESGQVPVLPATPAAGPLIQVPPAPVAAAARDAAVARKAEEIISQYEKSPATAASDVKKGCYLWFIFALGMFAICVVSLYFIYGASK